MHHAMNHSIGLYWSYVVPNINHAERDQKTIFGSGMINATTEVTSYVLPETQITRAISYCTVCRALKCPGQHEMDEEINVLHL